jgi:hypothetical protein
MPLQIVASDTAPGRTLTYTATGLPPGLSINSATGLITGTPNLVGSYNASVTATDNIGIKGSTNFAWSITGTTQGKKGLVGAEANTGVYGTTYADRTNFFDTNVGRPLARTTWTAYLSTVSQYQTGLNTPQPIGTANGFGSRTLLTFKPAVDTTNKYTTSTFAAEGTKVANMVDMFINNNVNIIFTFYNEMNNAANGFTGPNGIGVAGWAAFWKFYANIIHNHGGLVTWTPAMTHGFPNAIPYFPTNPLPDEVHPHVYSNDWYVHGYMPDTYGIDALVNPHNIPVGCGEFGPSNDPTQFTPTHAQWTFFCEDVMYGYWGLNPTTTYPNGGRLAHGLNNTDIQYFTDVKSSTAIGAIMSPSDYKVPGLQFLYDNLNA